MPQAGNVADMAFMMPNFKMAKMTSKEGLSKTTSFDHVLQQNSKKQGYEMKEFQGNQSRLKDTKDNTESQSLRSTTSETVQSGPATLELTKETVRGNIPEDNETTVQKIKDLIDAGDFTALQQVFAEMTEQVEGESDIDILKNLQQLLSDIKEMLLGSLNLTEDDLKQQMGILGISLMDLFLPDALKQLIVQTLGDGDATSFLMNEGLMDKFNQLMNELPSLLQSLQDTLNSAETAKLPEFLLEEEQMKSDLAFADLLKDKPSVEENALRPEEPAKANEKMESTSKDGTKDFSDINFQAQKISSSGDSKAGHDLTKRDGSPEQGALQFIDAMGTAVKAAASEFTEVSGDFEMIREIARQITDQIKVMVKPNTTSLELQLNPERLGKVFLNITSKEGVMTAQFTAQTQVAKEALESQLQILQQNLERQGLKVEGIEVAVGTFDFAQSGNTDSGQYGKNGRQGSNQSKRRQDFSADTLDRADMVNDDNAHLVDLMEANGTVVDYSI